MHVSILECPKHKVKGISIDMNRISSSECCGQWKVLQSWDIEGDDIARLLPLSSLHLIGTRTKDS